MYSCLKWPAWYAIWVAVLWVALEYATPRWLLPWIPPGFSVAFAEPEGVWPLMQTSKRAAVPREPYLALLGDSYAMGMGDAYMEALGQIHATDYHAGHVLHHELGMDVVSYGRPGAGSWRGLIGNYQGQVDYLRAVGSSWPEPAWMLFFFYEGNDLSENRLYQQFAAVPSPQAMAAPETLQAYVDNQVLGRDRLVRAADLQRERYYSFVWDGLRGLWQLRQNGQRERGEVVGADELPYTPIKRWLPRMQGRSLNHAMIAGETVALPGNLQAAAMDLSAEEREQALLQLELALMVNRQRWSEIPLVTVYIPAVLSCYELQGKGAEAQNLFADDTIKTTPVAVQAAHTLVRDRVAEIVQRSGSQWLDASSVLQASCRQQALHGPKDWNHLNAAGYQLLGGWLVQQLPGLLTLDSADAEKK